MAPGRAAGWVLRGALVAGVSLLSVAAPGFGAGWALLAHLDATGDLATDALAHAAVLQSAHQAVPLALQIRHTGMLPPGPAAAIGLRLATQDRDARSRLWRWYQFTDVSPITTARVVMSGGADQTPGQVADFVAWGIRHSGAQRLAVAVMGHGVPPDCEDPSGTLTFREAGSLGGMSGAELGRALRAGLVQGGAAQVEVLVLEACFGASLETLAELAGCAHYVLAIPGELPSPGLPWRGWLAAINGARDSEGPAAVVEALARATEAGGRESGPLPWSLSICDLSRFGAVEDALSQLSAGAAADLGDAVRAAQWARCRAQEGERLRQLCDAGELGRALRAHARGRDLQQAADRFADALRGLVVTRVRGEAGASAGWERRAGVTLFLPAALSGPVRGYRATSRLARSTGYGRFVEAYLAYCASLVPGLGGGSWRGSEG